MENTKRKLNFYVRNHYCRHRRITRHYTAMAAYRAMETRKGDGWCVIFDGGQEVYPVMQDKRTGALYGNIYGVLRRVI